MDSATPSIKPMTEVCTPKAFAKNKGRMFVTISLDTSMNKLVKPTAQTFRGRERNRFIILFSPMHIGILVFYNRWLYLGKLKKRSWGNRSYRVE